jgi:hypothetical protein
VQASEIDDESLPPVEKPGSHLGEVVIKGLEPVRPGIIAALHSEALADAAGIAAGRIPVQLCADEREFDSCIHGSRRPMLMAELGAQTSTLMLSRLISGHGLPVLAVLPSGPLPIAQIITLALSQTPFELVHDVSELAGAIRSAQGRTGVDCEIGEIARALAWRIDRESLEDVLGMLVLGRRRISVHDALARVDRTAVLRTALRERALPTPARLLGWGAAFHLVWQMERYGRDLSYVARSLGYESSRHASDSFKFHTGHAAMSVLRGQGFEGILDEFVRRLGSAERAPSLSATLNATDYLRICS